MVLTDASAAGVVAVRANDFLNSLGVCTHIAQGADSESGVAAALTYTGIRNIRDDGSTSATTLQEWIYVHNNTPNGAKVSLLPINGNVASSLYEYEQLAAAGALLDAEGPNEPNNWPVTYDGQTSSGTTSLPIAEFQRDLYAAVKADPKLAGIPVFASSEAGGSEPNNVGLQYLTIPSGAGTLLPDGTQYADYANTHNYVCDHLTGITENNIAWQAENPTLNSSWDGMYVEYGHTWWSPGYNGYTTAQLPTVPRVTTETGWVTQGTDAITQDQQGKLFMNLYLDAFKEGWSDTFIYMLHDSSSQGYWGLVNTDYSDKLSATYMHNMTTILADTSSAFTPGSVNYSIPNEPSTVHDMLIEKSNGTYELAVWDEEATGSDTVTVNLGATYGTVNLYDPTVGTSPTQTLTNASSVTLTLSDHPMIIELPALESLAGTPIANSLAPSLTPNQLGRVVQAAIADWAATGLSTTQIASLEHVQFAIATLPSGILGETLGNTITIDKNGYGWWLGGDDVAPNKVDLLTVVTHELGHELGLPDVNTQSQPNDVMDGTLAPGVRRQLFAELGDTDGVSDLSIQRWLEGGSHNEGQGDGDQTWLEWGV